MERIPLAHISHFLITIKYSTGYSGSLGLTYSFSDNWSAKANISRGYRAPNISEISANGVHPGTGIFQVGVRILIRNLMLQEDIGVNFTSQNSRHKLQRIL